MLFDLMINLGQAKTANTGVSNERLRTTSTALVGTALISLLSLLLLPYARNGLWFDDSLNSQTWGMVNRFQVGLWEFSTQVSKVWFTEYGRILLCWPAIYGFFYAIRDARLIRIADVALVIAHIGTVVHLLRRVRVSWQTISVFLMLLVSLFQIRYGDDPIAAYATFCQALGIAMTVALILLTRWQQTGGVRYLIASAVIATLSMLCYELNAIYVPIAVIAITMTTHGKRMRNLAIVLVPFLLFVVVNLYVKHKAQHPYAGSAFGSLGAVPTAYLKQLVATLPGSFYFLRAQPDYPLSQLIHAVVGSKIAWVIIGLSLICCTFFAKRSGQESSNVPRGLIFAAAAFIFLPPALIAISAKYQTQLAWGDAHLPVYYQYFGLAFLGAAALSKIVRWNVLWTLKIMAPVFAIYVASNWVVNMRQVTHLDAAYAEPRNSLVSSLKSGLLDPVRDGDVVEIVGQPIFINGNLIFQTIGKNISIPNEAAIAGWFESKPRSDANHYRLYRDLASGNTWKLSVQK